MIRFLLCVTVLPVLQGLTWGRLKKDKEAVSLTECYAAGVLILTVLLKQTGKTAVNRNT